MTDVHSQKCYIYEFFDGMSFLTLCIHVVGIVWSWQLLICQRFLFEFFHKGRILTVISNLFSSRTLIGKTLIDVWQDTIFWIVDFSTIFALNLICDNTTVHAIPDSDAVRQLNCPISTGLLSLGAHYQTHNVSEFTMRWYWSICGFLYPMIKRCG